MPVTKKRRAQDDEEEPRKKKRRAPDPDEYDPDDPEDDEDEDEDEEDERPRRTSKSKKRSSSRSRHADEDDEDEDDDDDDDDEDAEPGTLTKGWGGYKKNKSKTSDYPDRFTPTDEAQLIKFLEDEPFATYNQHWIERPGKKSFVCLGDDCPLCDIGDRPTAYAVFNILVVSEKSPALMTWEARPRLAELIESKSKAKQTKPLSKMYYSVTRTGKKSKATTTLEPVKERDLEEDWGIEPLSDKALRAFEKDAWDDRSVVVTPRGELKKIARAVASGDDEDDDD